MQVLRCQRCRASERPRRRRLGGRSALAACKECPGGHPLRRGDPRGRIPVGDGPAPLRPGHLGSGCEVAGISAPLSFGVGRRGGRVSVQSAHDRLWFKGAKSTKGPPSMGPIRGFPAAEKFPGGKISAVIARSMEPLLRIPVAVLQAALAGRAGRVVVAVRRMLPAVECVHALDGQRLGSAVVVALRSAREFAVDAERVALARFRVGALLVALSVGSLDEALPRMIGR